MTSNVKKPKAMSRWLAAFLAVAMMLASMSLSVFAAVDPGADGGEPTGTITVTNLKTADDEIDSVTVDAYRVIVAHFDTTIQQPTEPVYTWAPEVASWVAQHYSAYIDVDNNNAVTEAFGEITSDTDATGATDSDAADFYDALAAAIKNRTITLAPTKSVASDNGTATITEAPIGSYLILVRGGVRIYQASAVNLVPTYKDGAWTLETATITSKATDPTIDKEASDNSAAIGDTVDFTLRVDVPQYPTNAINKTFEIGDTFGAGLDFNNDIKVYGVADKNIDIADLTDEMLVPETAYDITYAGEGDPAQTETFIINFTDYAALAGYNAIIVTYSGTVTAEAFEGGTENGAYLGYNTNPYDDNDYDKDDTEVKVYNYGIEVSKVDGDGEDIDKDLPGAEFTFTKQGEKDPMALVKVDVDTEAGTYYYRPATKDDQTTTTTLVTDAEGKLNIKGLDLGTYTLTETKAPDGYNLPANPSQEIVLGDDDNNGVLNDDTDNTLELTVKNNNDSDFNLPVTGGMGTILFTIGGVVLMGAAVILVVVSFKRRREAN